MLRLLDVEQKPGEWNLVNSGASIGREDFAECRLPGASGISQWRRLTMSLQLKP